MKNRIFPTLILVLLFLTSCSRYIVRVPEDNHWKCIKAIQVDNEQTFEITQKARLKKGESVEVRLIKIVPFQDLESLPNSVGLDQLIRDKNCTELADIFRTGGATLPITFLDSGPLDLSGKNSKRTIKLTKGYQLIVRTNSPNAKISVKQLNK